MKILVIGNGFDLEHGLPTQYNNFLEFTNEMIKVVSNNFSPYKAFKFKENISLTNSLDVNLKKIFLANNFLNVWEKNTALKEFVELAKNNIWINYFNDNKFKEDNGEGWIDFESEISKVIQCFDYMKDASKYYNKYAKYPVDIDDYKEEIVEKIINYSKLDMEPFELIGSKLQELINVLNKHLNNLIRCLEIYLEECINKIEVEFTAPDIKGIDFDKVLSFNYTNTYQRVYDFNNSVEYDYIHGKADINRDISENNMVLGIDEYLDSEAKNKELEFIAFKKYFQRIYKKTGNTYKKWISEMEKLINYKLYSQNYSIDEAIDKESSDFLKKIIELEKYNGTNHIYIFGHSLDVTDKDIIKELIECPNTETTIFYYNKDVYAQQIANMVKIIGQDELIKRVSGANPTIIFKQQQKRIKGN